MTAGTPRLRIDGACRRLGRAEVVRRCERLLRGGAADADFLIILGGAAAIRLLNDGIPDDQSYWVRVWAVRGLLWAGPGKQIALRQALADPHWRVREMACKVIRHYRVGDLLDAVAGLENDGVRRVRSAASRATASIVAAEA